MAHGWVVAMAITKVLSHTENGHIGRIHIVFRVDHASIDHPSPSLMSHAQQNHQRHQRDEDGNRYEQRQLQWTQSKAQVSILRIWCNKTRQSTRKKKN